MSLLKILISVLIVVLVASGILVYVSLLGNKAPVNTAAPQETNAVLDLSKVTDTTGPGQVNIPSMTPATPEPGK